MLKKGTGLFTIANKSFAFNIGDKIDIGLIPKTGNMSLIAYPPDMNYNNTDLTGILDEIFVNPPDIYDVEGDYISFDSSYSIADGAETKQFFISYYSTGGTDKKLFTATCDY